jgi:hypothetical protein
VEGAPLPACALTQITTAQPAVRQRHTGSVVSDEERRAFERQAAALRSAETDDEGTLAFRHQLIEWANAERERRGIEPLLTEGEIHWRARTIGLLA